jgi:hypothetical protein
VLAAILVALLLCGGSFVVGVAVGHHRGGHRSGPQLPMGPYRGPIYRRPGQIGPGRFPPMRNIVPPTPPAAPPIPTPRPTHS